MKEDEDKKEKEIEEKGRSLKINLPDYSYVELEIQCKYHQIHKVEFFRLILDKLVEDDERIMSILRDWREKKKLTRINRNIDKMIAKKHENEKDFFMTEQELNDMYDQLEQMDKEQHE